MKEKIELAAFNYLIELKNKTGRDGRVSKIAKIEYERLEMQQYLSENKTTMISKCIVKARLSTLDVKTQKSWKYEDKTCVGCGLKEENGNEILKDLYQVLLGLYLTHRQRAELLGIIRWVLT